MRNLSIERKNKHFVLNQTKLKQAQKALGTKTETETIEVAIEMAFNEVERSQNAWASHEKFIRNAAKEGLQINDVFGRLDRD